MKVLVNGAGGQLGKDIVAWFGKHHEVVGLSKSMWDITDEKSSYDIVHYHKPDVVIHCAAYTNVDMSEDKPEWAYLVNVKATRELAKLCGSIGIRFVYISTDYVFDGASGDGYTENSFPHPLNVYGRTKRLGEKWTARCCPDHLIIRTSWLYGKHGTNFVDHILRCAQLGEPLKVVMDQVGSPTCTSQLAKHLLQLLQTNALGIFHLSNTGSCSWYTFAKKIVEISGIDVPVQAIISNQLTRKASRPRCSLLCSTRLSSVGIPNMPHWEDALDEYLEGINL